MTLRRALTGGLFGLVIAASAPMTAANAVPAYPVDETGGLTVSATSVMADAIESLAGAGPADTPRAVPASGRLGFATLRAYARMPAGRRMLLDERETKAKKRRADEDHARRAAGIA